MNYPRIYERVYCQVHAITAERFNAIHSVLFPRLLGGADSSLDALMLSAGDEQYRDNKERYSGKRSQRCGAAYMGQGRVDENFFSMAKPGVAVVPVYGVLAKNLSSYEESCGGGTDTAPISHAIQQATEAAGVSAIVLDIDSPGGQVTGITELGQRIRAAAAVKPVYAFSDAGCYSAAYWIASQATEIYGTRSSDWGSIGVRSGWLDETIAMQLRGLKLETFSAGKYKAAGMPFRGLTKEDRAMIQAKVDFHYGEFTSAIQSVRPSVEMDAMQGQTFTAPDAVENHLIDGLVDDWESFISML
ncbi:MAG: S49 family peptidase [Verrucomicrobiota bacterium]